MPADQMRRFRLEWRTGQVHARSFALAELRQMAGPGHQILFEDDEPDTTALESIHDDGFFARTPWWRHPGPRWTAPTRSARTSRSCTTAGHTDRAARHLAHHSR